MATREICRCCGRESPLGFSVSDEVWARSVPEAYPVLCILCFDYFATLNGVKWTEGQVEFWPVSGAYFALSEGQTYQEVAARTVPPTIDARTITTERVEEAFWATWDIDRWERLEDTVSVGELQRFCDAMIARLKGDI